MTARELLSLALLLSKWLQFEPASELSVGDKEFIQYMLRQCIVAAYGLAFADTAKSWKERTGELDQLPF